MFSSITAADLVVDTNILWKKGIKYNTQSEERKAKNIFI